MGILCLRLALLTALLAVLDAGSAALLSAPSYRVSDCNIKEKKKRRRTSERLAKATRACARVHLCLPLLGDY